MFGRDVRAQGKALEAPIEDDVLGASLELDRCARPRKIVDRGMSRVPDQLLVTTTKLEIMPLRIT